MFLVHVSPVRNEMAVQAGLENLPGLLSIVLLVMLIANPVYSWLVSRINRNRIVLYFYCFYLKLIGLLFSWILLDASWRLLLQRVFIFGAMFSLFLWSQYFGFHDQLFQWISAKLYFGIISAAVP